MKPVKTAFGCIRFLIVNATRYNATDTIFDAELQQLGLPKEHSAAICRVHSEYAEALRTFLSENTLKGKLYFLKKKY